MSFSLSVPSPTRSLSTGFMRYVPARLASELAATQTKTTTSSHFFPLIYFSRRSIVRFASFGF